MISESCKISIPLYCKIFEWYEKSREKCFLIHGINKSSYGKKIPNTVKTGLVGNKVLIDGFNNDFKDYPNSYERLRHQYKHYYFIDDKEKKLITEQLNLKFLSKESTDTSILKKVNGKGNTIGEEANKSKGLESKTLPLIISIDKRNRLRQQADEAKYSNKLRHSYGKNASLYLSFHEENLRFYQEKFCNGLSTVQRAEQLLNYSYNFKAKTWLQQVQLSALMIQKNFKKLNSF
jgi:hypothetical protein